MTSLKGLHWGKVELEEKLLSFVVDEKDTQKNLFKIPLKKINNSTVNKNDIILDINTDDAAKDDDMLSEIRFFVVDQAKTATEAPQQDVLAEDGEQERKAPVTVSFATTLNNEIIEKAKIGELAGQSIATLHEISLVVPRGKYSIDFYQKNMRFHGSTFNYNVDYKNIQRGFMLPMPNEPATVLVLQLAKPIHQGQTVHPYIVIQIKKEIEQTIKTKIKPQYIKDSPHLEKVKPEIAGELEDILAELLRTVVGVETLIVPGDNFKSHSGDHCVKCSRGTQGGWLYFLKKSLIFVTKPVVYFKITDVTKVQFQRMSSHNKLFDIKIWLKNGQVSSFVGIERLDSDNIFDYFKQRGVNVVKAVDETAKASRLIDADDSEDDESFESGEEDDDDESEDDDFEADEDESVESKQKKGKKDKEKQKEKGK